MHLKIPRVKSLRLIANRKPIESLENRVLLSNSPSVMAISPANGATGVALNANVQIELNLPNGGINPTTVNNSTFYLYQTKYPNQNNKQAPSSVKTTGGGDALLLTPSQNLLPNTSYTLVVTSAVTDVHGDAFTPFSETFTTGSTIPPVNTSYAFSKTALPTTNGYAITDVQMGPDGELWASDEVGQILRFAINGDGTLGTPQVINSLQTAYGGNRLVTGFAFDPSFVANPSAPMIWVSNTAYGLSAAANPPDYSGALTVMSGSNLQIVTNVVVDLPRSVADHVNNQPVFQPGTHNLFWCQAGENAFGAADTTWGNRVETLLSAAILELNTASPLLNINTPSQPPLNVLTPDCTAGGLASGAPLGGTYNPYAAGAPVTIYATGIRNAFQLFFDDKGQLWAPANGSSSGGNAPAGPGNSPPALNNIQQVEEDAMFKVVQGAYYGHPDPARNQYILDQGNPSTGAVPGLAFTAYPSGTNPDPNYQLPNYVFGLHSSPDAMIEYQGSAFGGALNGKFLVTEYSAPDDIVVLSRDSNNNIIGGLASSVTTPGPDRTVTGFTGLDNPLSIVENPSTGYIYVSQIDPATGGAVDLVLLKPAALKQQQISASTTVLPFNTIAAGHTGAGPSRIETVTITNQGNSPLNISSIGIVNNPADAAAASRFTIVNAAKLPLSLSSQGSSVSIQIRYTATIVGLQSAILQISSNDPANPTLNIDLNGIGTPGQFGTAEPSLVQVLRAYDIPTIVGAGPNDVNINTQKYPINPDASSQEVAMQRLVAADSSQPVTITPIVSFSAATSAVSRIGYYTPGDPGAKTELFYIGKSDAQTVQPTAIGSTSFNPGTSEFGLYGTFPGTTTSNGSLDTHYSEDALNTLDPTHARKIRFFPLKTASGTIVPNTYVFAIEDYDNPSAYNSFINFDGIISNVMAAPNATAGSTPSSATANNPPVMGVQPNGLVPGSNNLVFNDLTKPNGIMADVVHNQNTVTINNTGDQPLIINSLTLANTTAGSSAAVSSVWQLVNPPAPGTAIPAGSSLTVTIQFVANSNPPHTANETNDLTSTTGTPSVNAGGVWSGTLTVNSNDPVNPTGTVNLRGWWQIESEHENEPSVATLTNLMFGYSTPITGSASLQNTEFPNNGNTVVIYPGEVDPQTNQGLLVAADPTQPVSIVEAAAFHQQYVTVSATVGKVTQGVAMESETGHTVTITTTTPTAFKVGNKVTIAGDISGYNGTFTIVAVTSTHSFTYTDAISGLAPYAPKATQPQTGWYTPGSATHFLYKDQPNNGQAVLPLTTSDSYSTVQTTFAPTGAFGLNIDGQRSQDSANTGSLPFNTSEHGVRFWPVIDANGNTVPNTYIIGMDYRSYATPNSDYQDLYEIISNVTFASMPATPIDLQATAGPTGVKLQWASVSGASGYNVYRATSAGGPFTKLTSAPTTAASFVDSQASTGTTSYYRVTAVNSSGVESVAATASAIASTSNVVTPATPTGLTGNSPSSSEIDINWTASTGATSYTVQRSSDNGTTWTTLPNTTTLPSYADTTVSPSTTYEYRVIASNSSGSSNPSSAFTITSAASVTTFTSADLGSPLAGSTTTVTNDSAYNVTAGGLGIYNAADSCRFVYTQVTGNFDIAVQVSSLSTVTGAFAQAGLMARATLDAASPEVAITASTSAGAYRFKQRATSGAATTQTQALSSVVATFPAVWVRLKRVGNVFTSYYSTNGTSWTTLASTTLTTLPSTTPIYVGMAVASNSSTQTTTADFQNLTGL